MNDATMYEHMYWKVQETLDRLLGTEEEDGAGAGIVADVELLGQQRDTALAEVKRLTRVGEQDRAAADRYDAAARNYSLQCDRSDALAGALRALVEHEDDPCVLDHHGYCQQHNLSRPCSVAAARRLLGLDGTT